MLEGIPSPWQVQGKGRWPCRISHSLLRSQIERRAVPRALGKTESRILGFSGTSVS